MDDTLLSYLRTTADLLEADGDMNVGRLLRLAANRIEHLENEIKRLRDGIAEHKRTMPHGENAWDRRLWALIEEGDDG